MLDAEDQVEFGAGSDSSSTACYRHFDEKSNRKSCTLGAAKVGDKYKAGIMFELEESWYPWEDGTGDYKYLYKLSIDVAPGEFDKVIEDEDCIFYTKDQIIDMFWNDYLRRLESVDYGLSQVMDTSLSDAGINWKK